MKTRFAVLAFALIACFTVARAETLIGPPNAKLPPPPLPAFTEHVVTVPFSTGIWDGSKYVETFEIPQHNPALGRLRQVIVTLGIFHATELKAENWGDSPCSWMWAIHGLTRVQLPSGPVDSVMDAVPPPWILGPFDGSSDGHGTSGFTNTYTLSDLLPPMTISGVETLPYLGVGTLPIVIERSGWYHYLTNTVNGTGGHYRRSALTMRVRYVYQERPAP